MFVLCVILCALIVFGLFGGVYFSLSCLWYVVAFFSVDFHWALNKKWFQRGFQRVVCLESFLKVILSPWLLKWETLRWSKKG